MAMVESLLKNLDLKPADIGLIAVANGPGSFTGVRIGVSAAKGLASGLDIPVCGVSTLEAMAYQTGAQSSSCIICPVMDARRQQVYNALFEWKNGAPVRIKDDRAISLEDLAAELLTLNSQASALNLLLVGDGAAITQDYLTQKTDIPVSTAPELQRYQTAYGVTLAALHKEPVAAAVLEPNYLRPSQAERERNKP
jgi:tRNA threonylcarbamoyladenosine biosynthesis protein TsaB